MGYSLPSQEVTDEKGVSPLSHPDQLHVHLVWELHGLRLEVSAESGEDSGEDQRDPTPAHPGHCTQTLLSQGSADPL